MSEKSDKTPREAVNYVRQFGLLKQIQGHIILHIKVISAQNSYYIMPIS